MHTQLHYREDTVFEISQVDMIITQQNELIMAKCIQMIPCVCVAPQVQVRIFQAVPLALVYIFQANHLCPCYNYYIYTSMHINHVYWVSTYS